MRIRKLVGVVATLGTVALLSACGPFLDAPSGQAPLRYRDQVFTDVSKTADLVYGNAPDSNNVPVDLKLDLYQPVGDAVTARPAIIWIHGGGFSSGTKSDGYIVDLAQDSAKRGYVAISLEYRLLAPSGCGGSGTPSNACATAAIGAQYDAQAAVRWLRLHAADYKVDPNRIAMGGASAGAITSDLVALRSDDPGNSGNPGPSSAIGGAVSISGGLPTGTTASFAQATDAPILEFHGTADDVVPYQWGLDMVQAAQAAGMTAYYESLLNAGHVPYAQYSDLFKTQSAYFLYQQMDLAHAAH
jgi:carboxylesterase type B